MTTTVVVKVSMAIAAALQGCSSSRYLKPCTARLVPPVLVFIASSVALHWPAYSASSLFLWTFHLSKKMTSVSDILLLTLSTEELNLGHDIIITRT